MALQPFTSEQLNYFKLAFVVLDEYPKALRQTFKYMWDNFIGSRHGHRMWDDSNAVRNVFLGLEGGKSRVPTHLSYDEWDSTALFQATIYSQAFALRHSKGGHTVLSDLYIKPLGLSYGSFHASVTSFGGIKYETFTLAIDQLRVLRNSLLHSATPEIDKVTFNKHVQLSKDAFKALGLKTDPIDAIASLTDSDFPTPKVLKLEQELRKALQADQTFLQEDVKKEICYIKDEVRGIRSDIVQLQTSEDERKRAATAANQDVKESIAELKEKHDMIEDMIKSQKPGTNLSLKRPSLPPIVPHFTGRKRVCDEIICQVTSESTRLVSLWGSPGFGKTSVAIAVGHELQSLGLPVYFLSLRGLKSKADLTSKFLGLLRQGMSLTHDQTSQQLSLDDELCETFSKISDLSLVFILDNADDLLEAGTLNVKDEVIDLLEEILRNNEKVKFFLTSRESLQFMDIRFPGHQGSRIEQLDDIFSQELVHKLLPMASASDCKKITQVCGHVPLAIKLLCSSISENEPVELSQYLENYLSLEASTDIIQILDNPDYPSNLRLQVLFDTSFQRLSEDEKRALVSLAILPDNFHLDIAAAVLGLANTAKASKILQRLRRKSLLDSGTTHGLFSIHKLIQSFSREKGEQKMQETVSCAKSRFRAYYVKLFENLNEKFLRGHSMSAFIEFYEEKQGITESLIESCSDPKVADDAFDVLAAAEQFLDMLLWKEGASFIKIYDSALEESHKRGKSNSYRKLLVSKAFSQITWGKTGKTQMLLDEAKELQASSSSVPNEEQGKLLCYLGMHSLVANETEKGVKCLHESLSLMSNIPALVILKLITYQILAVYYQCINNPASASYYQTKALQECKCADKQHLVIPPSTRKSKAPQEETPSKHQANAPLLMQVLYHVSKATENVSDIDTQQGFGNNALKIVDNVAASQKTSLGLCNFHRIVAKMLQELQKYEEAVKFAESAIMSHQIALQQCESNEKKGNEAHSVTSSKVHEEALVGNYLDLGQIHYSKGNYSAALQSHHLALDLAVAVFGDEHQTTAACYYHLGWTHFQLEDYTSSLPYSQLALNMRRKLFGEDHSLTANSYRSVGYTQHELGDYKSALKSKTRELDIRLKLFGEDDPRTADSYRSLGQTYNEIGDYSSALPLKQHEVAIRMKVFGEEHSKTAASFRSLGYTQHQLGDYSSALQSKEQELDIRLRLFGEKHLNTADSYHSIGETQHQLGHYQPARLSFQHALDIRLELLGEDHADTAESYHELGVTHHQLGNYTSALQSKQHAVDTRLKLFGDEHLLTADSWHELGVSQHKQGDYTSARQSLQHALGIRAKLLGEGHAETAKSNHLLEVIHEASRQTSGETK